MDEQFDIAALEKALSAKGRRQDLAPKLGLSNQELFDEAKRLQDECYDLFYTHLQTRHQGGNYYISGDILYRSGRVVDHIKVPREVFMQLISNGRRRLKVYHDMINTLIMQYPTIALEANLEGKTGRAFLSFAFDRRVDQLQQLLDQRVSIPKDTIKFTFYICIKSLTGKEFPVTISWGYRHRVVIENIDIYTRQSKEMRNLFDFITNFEQVIDAVNSQLDKIEIRKKR